VSAMCQSPYWPIPVAALFGWGVFLSARGAPLTASAAEEAMVASGSPATVWDPRAPREISPTG